jgi:hypothetical protein
MRTNWQTYPIELKGGLITNLSALQQGINAPGSASALVNYEASIDGGYAKVLGYSKWTTHQLPGTGVVQGVISVSNEDVIAVRGGKYYFSDAGANWVEKLNSSSDPGTKIRHTEYNFNGTKKVMMVNGATKPVIFDSGAATIAIDSGAPSDVDDAECVVEFKNHIFISKGSNLVFTAPFTDDDYDPANGAGVINVGDRIVGLVAFREQLIVFSTDRINLIAGNSVSDFVMQPITKKTGCINGDTIQEIGGDILYLGPDGIRYLSGTDKNDDFALERASENIQGLVTNTLASGAQYTSLVVREKSQYRIIKWNEGDKYLSLGFLGTRFTDQQPTGIAWSTIQGFKAYCSDSKQYSGVELVIFANDDGYVYKMESGTNFDGDEIPSSFRTPDLPVTDPMMRKTWYKLTTYLKSDFAINLTLQVILDSGRSGVIQPQPVNITSNGNSVVYFWDDPTTIWDSFVWSDSVDSVVNQNLIGSSHTISFNFYETSTTSSFSLDTLLLEYRQNDRK